MSIKYTESGLWIEKLEDSFRIGLSEKGQDDVGEVMFLEIPAFDGYINKGDALLGVEGAKAVTEIVAPCSESVKSIHTDLEDEMELLNSTSKTDNWIVEVRDVTDLDENELSDDPWFGQEPEEN